MNTHVEDLVAHPQRHFQRPDEVLADHTLTLAEKRRALESWKLDAMRLAESTAENMGGGEETDLREVSKVLLQLKSLETAPETHTSKTGANLGIGMGGGALVGAGVGLVVSAVTVPSLAIVAQASFAGLMLGGVAAALRNSTR